MRVKDLQALIDGADPEAILVVAGYETIFTNFVADIDMAIKCQTLPVEGDPKPMDGTRRLVKEGEPTLWLGWSKDYRTEPFLEGVADPDLHEDG